MFNCSDGICHHLRNARDIHCLISIQCWIEIRRNEPTWKGEQTVGIPRNVRLAHINVYTDRNNIDKFKKVLSV